MQIVIDIGENLYTRLFDMRANTMRDMRAACSTIRNGTPLPEGAEILTKEAYSDLCMRASRAESEVQDAGSNATMYEMKR